MNEAVRWRPPVREGWASVADPFICIKMLHKSFNNNILNIYLVYV